jgi:hypothetical protein
MFGSGKASFRLGAGIGIPNLFPLAGADVRKL